MKKILVLITAIAICGCNKIDDQESIVINENFKFEKSITNAQAVELYKNDQNQRLNYLKKGKTPIEERGVYFELRILSH